MILPEDRLSAALRAGKLDNLYFLYGREPFLTKMYVDRIIKKSVGTEPFDFNLVKLEGVADADALSEYVEGLPVFAEKKAVIVHDPDFEGMNKDTAERVLEIIKDVPETTVLVFYITNEEYDEKKIPPKVSKFIKEIDKHGTVSYMDAMQPSKLSELAIKKAAKQGIVISPADADYLVSRVCGSMVMVSDEMSKLISYCGTGGIIGRDIIDKLVVKQLDAEIYDLSAAINEGRKSDAYRIIGDLFDCRYQPEHIMTALSGSFIDYYRCKLAKSSGVSSEQTGEIFGYGKRAWVLRRVFSAVARLQIGYLRETVSILADADMQLKSSSCDSRTIIEQAVTNLFMCRERYR